MKGYIVGNFNILNLDKYMEYAKLSGPILKQYNGKLIVAGQPSSIKEGEPNHVTVVVEFNSIEEAEKYYNSEEYQSIASIRKESSSGWLEIMAEI